MKNLFTAFLFVLLAIGTANAQWTTQTSGVSQTLYSVSAVSDQVAWVCGVNGTVLRTTNGGSTWTGVGTTPVAGTLYNVFGIDISNALVTTSASNATVWKTTNGGATWEQVFIQPGGFINVIHIEGNVGFMQGDPVDGRWSLWKSTDAGTNWDSTGMYLQQAGTEAGWNNSLYASLTNYWFGTNNSKIYYSSNSGLTWTGQNCTEVNTYAVWFNTPLTGVSGGTEAIMTTNGGAGWSVTPIGGSGNISGVAGYGTNFWLVQGSGIYRSTNNGSTWTSDHTATGTLNDIAISRNGTMLWAVGSVGSIYTNSGTVGISNTTSNVPDRYFLSQNFPNPFNPTTKINFDITKNSFVSLKLYNSIGQEVSNLVNQNLTAGSYEVTFEGTGLTSGIYFYTINTGEFVQTNKMMLVK